MLTVREKSIELFGEFKGPYYNLVDEDVSDCEYAGVDKLSGGGYMIYYRSPPCEGI